MISWQYGMEWAFGYFQGCQLLLMWKWRPMQQAPWALGHITTVNSSVVLGCLPRLISPLLTRNCFLWWWLPMYGVLRGRGYTFFFGVIMRLWCTSWLPGHRGSLASCAFFVIYSLQLLALTSLSLHSISQFVCRNSGGWHPRHSFTRFQSFLNSGSSWSFHPKGSVTLVFGAGSGFCSQLEKIHLSVSLRNVFGQHCSTLNNQDVSLRGSLTAYWAELRESSRWLPAVTASS